MENKSKKLFYNYPAIIVLIFYPILLIVLAILYSKTFGIDKKDIIIATIGYYICNITVGIGLHRLWAHGSYKVKPWVETVLMIISAGCLQGPALIWASDHKFHHSYADGENDPHTPVKYKNKLKGLLWAHIGWMLVSEHENKHIDKATMLTLGRRKILLFQLKYYWQLATFMNIIPPMILGMFIYNSYSLHAAYAGFLFVGLGRALQQQMTFCVNSVCHFKGTKEYANDSSCDVWWMAPMVLGENWHNFHHAFGRDYRNGHKWYHFDMHKWIIWGMYKLGLAWDLVITSEDRINATVIEMKKNTIKPRMESLIAAAEAIANVASIRSKEIRMFISDVTDNICDANQIIYTEFDEIKKYLLHHSSDKIDELKYNITNKFNKVNKSLEDLQQKAKDFAEFASKKIENSRTLNLNFLEKSLKYLHKLNIEAEKLGIQYSIN
ncbi:putative acyl-CoA desaturase [Lyticum sinuosum]|uniref:Acyl-CoA desaturase n=1 Tax=Lyticum sinuosum TaxID=1332059 RepID=A0AAE4VJI0_9RICK|nr:fatty acid desaturase [Lyticum sinuosum]MDZ5761170.1 putative acyl-CoA desaturase [Lyticum sinuosum]